MPPIPPGAGPQPAQLDLFTASPAAAAPAHAVHAAEPGEQVRTLAGRMPPGVRLGTSSWHFPGWARLVYDHPANERVLARDGLAAYARHPLLRCVGLDRAFHAPIGVDDYRACAAQVPPDFRFVVKAPIACTAAQLRPHGAGAHSVNPRFLDARFATEQFVGPCLAGLGERAGVLLFQFPPLGRELLRHPEVFAARLGGFLARLPAAATYAIELRDHALVGPAYLDVLARRHAQHCLSLHPRMPVASEQARETGLDRAGTLCVRWNLHAGLAYDEAKLRYAPFTRLVDEDLPNRVALARLALAAVARGDPVFVIAHNEAEGSAPLTLTKLAEQIVSMAATLPPRA